MPGTETLLTGLAIVAGALLVLKLVGWGIRMLVRSFFVFTILLVVIYYVVQRPPH